MLIGNVPNTEPALSITEKIWEADLEANFRLCSTIAKY